MPELESWPSSVEVPMLTGLAGIRRFSDPRNSGKSTSSAGDV